MVTTRAADRVGLSPHKQLNSHRPATAVVQPDFQETPHAHEGYSAVRHQDSESASTSSRQAADGAAVAETTSSPASQPEVMISGRRRRALADLQSQAAAAGSRPGIKKRQASHCDAHGGQTSGHTPAMSSIPRVSKHSRGHARQQSSAKHSGLIGRIVDVPADVFSVDIPDMYYRGIITKRDYAHKDSFEVKFLEDGTRYWLPIADCQHWLGQMEARGRSETSQTVGAASDTFAASILAGFHGPDRPGSSQDAWTAAASASGQHSRHTQRRRLTRSSSEPDISNLQRLASAV